MRLELTLAPACWVDELRLELTLAPGWVDELRLELTPAPACWVDEVGAYSSSCMLGR